MNNIKTIDFVKTLSIHVLALLAFFIPLNQVRGVWNLNTSLWDHNWGPLLFVLFIIVFALLLVLRFGEAFSERFQPAMLDLGSLVALAALTILFFVIGFRDTGDYGMVSIKIGVAPFYMMALCVLADVLLLRDNSLVRGLLNKVFPNLLNDEKTHDPHSKLRQLKSMVDDALISQEEYEMKRKKIMDEM